MVRNFHNFATFTLLLNVFSALKGTHFYIIFGIKQNMTIHSQFFTFLENAIL